MTDGDIMDALTEIFRELFGDDALTLSRETTANDIPGWDSIKHISLIVAVEAQFRIKMKAVEIDGLHTVGDLADIIRRKAG